MKFLIVCLAIAGCASAGYVGYVQPHQQQFQYNQQYLTNEAQAPVLRSTSDIRPDGTYEYSYETGNGIIAQESGVGGHSVSGSSSYTAPDGTAILLNYVADENGFNPVGDHIPTAPPVPEYIARALAYIQAHPPKDEPQYRAQSPVVHYQSHGSFGGNYNNRFSDFNKFSHTRIG